MTIQLVRKRCVMSSNTRFKSCGRSFLGCLFVLLNVCTLCVTGCVGANGAGSTAIPASTTSSAAVPGRGMWFWAGSSSDQFSSTAIVGNLALETQTIANLQSWNVTTLYGSYNSLIQSNPAAVQAWNQMLASAHIQSYVLFSNTNNFLPEDWDAEQSEILTNFVDFNASAAQGAGFVGIAFDVEPDSFAGTTTRLSWNASTTATRRTYLTYFLNMLQSSRALLNENGQSAAPMETALATWYATLNSSIGWANSADVDQWFGQLAQTCTRVSLMAYEVSTPSLIISDAQVEGSLLGSTPRISLRSTLGVEWTTLPQFWQALQAVETQTSGYVDIEDYETTAN